MNIITEYAVSNGTTIRCTALEFLFLQGLHKQLYHVLQQYDEGDRTKIDFTAHTQLSEHHVGMSRSLWSHFQMASLHDGIWRLYVSHPTSIPSSVAGSPHHDQ